MALSAQEQERIIAEETLRFETRAKLISTTPCHGAATCGMAGHGCHRCRPLVWLGLAILLCAAFHIMHCHTCWNPGYGHPRSWGAQGMMDQDAQEAPAVPAPKVPAKK